MNKTLEGRTWSPGHTGAVFNPGTFKELVNSTSEALEILGKRFDFNCLASSGNSGNLLAGALSYKLELPLLVVRKSGDASHDDLKVNGFRPDVKCKYIIIDDLIDTGKTMKRIIKQIKLASNKEKTLGFYKDAPTPECAGILLYNDSGGRPYHFIYEPPIWIFNLQNVIDHPQDLDICFQQK